MMRSYGILLVLGLLFAFIAFQARTGIFRRANSGEPANKYTRAMMEDERLSEKEQAVIREQYAGAIISSTGLRTLIRTPGSGNPPAHGATVIVDYDGYLLDGAKKFDSSRDRGKPFSFRVGTGAVIKGWDEAVATMRVGEKRTIIIPWWLAYGQSGKGPIPPRATLVFEVELVSIQ
jgi:FKBP-type peptidyl-prolyl cis-trans isomerase